MDVESLLSSRCGVDKLFTSLFSLFLGVVSLLCLFSSIFDIDSFLFKVSEEFLSEFLFGWEAFKLGGVGCLELGLLF